MEKVLVKGWKEIPKPSVSTYTPSRYCYTPLTAQEKEAIDKQVEQYKRQRLLEIEKSEPWRIKQKEIDAEKKKLGKLGFWKILERKRLEKHISEMEILYNIDVYDACEYTLLCISSDIMIKTAKEKIKQSNKLLSLLNLLLRYLPLLLADTSQMNRCKNDPSHPKLAKS